MAETIKNAEKKGTEETVSIILPRLGKNDESAVFVSLNFKNYLIKRGVRVDVPKAVADMLQSNAEAEDEAYEYSKSKEIKEDK